MALMLSGGPLAMPMIFAFDACAWRMNDERSAVVNGMSDRAQHLAAVLRDHRGGIAFQRMAEGIVGGEEEPAVAAALGDLLGGADGKRAGVEHPLQGVGRAELAVEVGGAGGVDDQQFLFFVGDILHREPDRRDRHVDDEVNLIAIVPSPG